MAAFCATSSIDLAELFNEMFGMGPFPTLDVFQVKLSHFHRQTGTSYVIGNIISRELRTAKRRLINTDFARPLLGALLMPLGKQCPALICLV
ncbi:hypothetical protein X801_07766 [Opisthorchis viverrini]|uniref:Uncharacterized protein n=1 Tax=Opisthorchis viverrini TaxID=6198 RepID=A0A1S8WPS8_OPIVI|nr:hypothetical protein X801_07766 [Opisthorchis viverrini]